MGLDSDERYEGDLMEQLEALGDLEILEDAKKCKEKIDWFMEAFHYVVQEGKLPDGWEIKEFFNMFKKLSNDNDPRHEVYHEEHFFVMKGLEKETFLIKEFIKQNLPEAQDEFPDSSSSTLVSPNSSLADEINQFEDISEVLGALYMQVE